MAVQTLENPTVDEQQKLVRNRTRRGNSVPISTSQKFAVVLLKLAPAVTQADYPALVTAIKAIPGIQDISLLVDGVTDTSCPPTSKFKLVSEVMVRMDDLPEMP